MKHLFVLLLCSGFACQQLFAQFPLKHRPGTYQVIARSGLNMRAAPELGARLLKKLPYGAKVEVQESGFQMITVGWMQGYWAKVNHQNQTGYVFGPYLSRLPLPADELESSLCADMQEFGFEPILTYYINQHLDSAEVRRTLYDTGPLAEESHLIVESQWYKQNVQVVTTVYYESSSTALRVPGTDIFQLYALLETLMKACEQGSRLIQNPIFIRDTDQRIIEIRDAGTDGFIFRIRQIDAATAELEMSSGV
ncbi:MAG: SH3 domain-containing protein [Bacteroidetes bacterium]|nr:MAG: SH3 domain-containing protein [Bacteroidota bacterium]